MEFDQSLGLKRETTFDAIILYVATGLFALTIVLATIQVIVRVFGIGIFGAMHWTEPAARFILIVATYWGAAVASRNDEHIRMNYVLDKLEENHPKVRSGFEVVVAIVVIAFVAIALRGTVGSAYANWHTSIGGIGFITSGVIYLGIAIGLAVMLYYEGANLFERFRIVTGIKEPPTDSSAEAGSGATRPADAVEESTGTDERSTDERSTNDGRSTDDVSGGHDSDEIDVDRAEDP